MDNLIHAIFKNQYGTWMKGTIVGYVSHGTEICAIILTHWRSDKGESGDYSWKKISTPVLRHAPIEDIRVG